MGIRWNRGIVGTVTDLSILGVPQEEVVDDGSGWKLEHEDL